MVPVLKLDSVSKGFPGVRALDQVSISFVPGEIHAVMGENGAGKSTLMKIIAALYTPDSGSLTLNGTKTVFHNPNDAIKNGIAMIHQELTPIPNMKVYENIFIGREIVTRYGSLLRSQAMIDATKELFENLDIKINPQTLAKDLSVAELQLVEIAKAMSYKPQILIMDEPTSALSESEVSQLYKLILDQKSKGTTILYISHKLNEVFTIADRVTVLRDGKMIGSERIADVNENELIRMMVGRDVDIYSKRVSGQMGNEVLRADNLTHRGSFQNISFSLHRGEILGIAGLMGAGRTELSETLMGLRSLDSGEVYIHGKKQNIKHPFTAIQSGMTLVPEDRKNIGLNIGLSVEENLMVPNLAKYSTMGLVHKNKLRIKVKEQIQKLRVKTSSIHTVASTLSGGNQQKLVIAKWLIADTDIIILDEPTRGIDIGAKTEIHQLINELANSGKAIILISSELPEITSLSDQVLVLYKGEKIGQYMISDFKEQYLFNKN